MSTLDAQVQAFLAPFDVRLDSLKSLVVGLSQTFRDLAATSRDQFIPTPVCALPTGRERGRVLALDLGGTNLRIAFVELFGSVETSRSSVLRSNENDANHANELPNGDKACLRTIIGKSWPIKDAMKMDNEAALFSWIGDCIAEVISDYFSGSYHVGHHDEAGIEIPLGITFSFPMIQTSLPCATLMPMGKGFAVRSEKDLGELLLAGYKRYTGKSLERSPQFSYPALKVIAIANDAVATLISLCYQVRREPIGSVVAAVILATGSNAAIPMNVRKLESVKVKNIEPFQESHSNEQNFIINTEWSLYGTGQPFRDHEFVTKWDAIISDMAERPGFQPFEYMTAGRYLGELVRLVILELFTMHLKFQPSQLPVLLRTRNGLTSKYLGSIVAQSSLDPELLSRLNSDLPSPEFSSWNWTIENASIFKRIAETIQHRSAALLAAAIVALLKSGDYLDSKTVSEHSKIKEGCDECNGHQSGGTKSSSQLVVACAGGVISNYPGYIHDCQAYIDAILQNNHGPTGRSLVLLREAQDGGLNGAAVLAGTILFKG